MKTYVGVNNTSKAAEEIYVGYKNKAVSLWPLTGKTDRIYGAVWDGSATTAWTRTDDARGFVDPTPQHAISGGGWSTGSSPFDNIMPWSGMVKTEYTNAGIVVSIPKFYYKMGYADTANSKGLKIQISMKKHPGFKTSPAHMDRGDGAGERDVVYVGRYHCASDYKSKTGVTPKVNTTRPTFRSGIHALGTGIWQWDYATLVTIWMLYLVEFADWNSQAKIGGGGSATTAKSSAVYNMGSTDTMPYHTGTVSNSIGAAVYGANQYRNIENLWGNAYQLTDGIYHSGASVYIILNPADFSDSTGGTLAGSMSTSVNYISAFSIPNAAGLEWAILPSSTNGTETTYTCDWLAYTGSSGMMYGGNYSQAGIHGLFMLNANFQISTGYTSTGSRLMILP